MEEYEQGSSAIQINSVRENGQGAQKHTPGRKRAGVAPVRAGEVVDRSCKSCLASSRCPLPPPHPDPSPKPREAAEELPGGGRGVAETLPAARAVAEVPAVGWRPGGGGGGSASS